jgi:hypothetical protein
MARLINSNNRSDLGYSFLNNWSQEMQFILCTTNVLVTYKRGHQQATKYTLIYEVFNISCSHGVGSITGLKQVNILGWKNKTSFEYPTELLIWHFIWYKKRVMIATFNEYIHKLRIRVSIRLSREETIHKLYLSVNTWKIRKKVFVYLSNHVQNVTTLGYAYNGKKKDEQSPGV